MTVSSRRSEKLTKDWIAVDDQSDRKKRMLCLQDSLLSKECGLIVVLKKFPWRIRLKPVGTLVLATLSPSIPSPSITSNYTPKSECGR